MLVLIKYIKLEKVDKLPFLILYTAKFINPDF